MKHIVLLLVLSLSSPGCVRFARVEYTYPLNYLDSTTGLRLKTPKGAAHLDIGSGVRLNGGHDPTPIIQVAPFVGNDRFRIHGSVEVTVPEARFSGSVGIEVEF